MLQNEKENYKQKEYFKKYVLPHGNSYIQEKKNRILKFASADITNIYYFQRYMVFTLHTTCL